MEGRHPPVPHTFFRHQYLHPFQTSYVQIQCELKPNG